VNLKKGKINDKAKKKPTLELKSANRNAAINKRSNKQTNIN
jgi:hypothetical protein